jgi:glycosyltransferase involved in cell wall biosynthesis
VIYNGVDLARWSSQPEPDAQALLRSRWGLNNAKYAIYVGDARWRKNLRGMLQGLAQARCIAPHLNLQLVWAGALSSDHEKAIDEETRVLDLSNAVHRIGFVSDADLSLLYRDAVAHLFVSRYEGFGLTVVEAMASGCPVITTRRTSLAEVAGDAALDVDPDDYQGIGEALVRVSSDPSLRSDLQERGLRRAQRFSHVRQARETLDIYRRVL